MIKKNTLQKDYNLIIMTRNICNITAQQIQLNKESVQMWILFPELQGATQLLHKDTYTLACADQLIYVIQCCPSHDKWEQDWLQGLLPGSSGYLNDGHMMTNPAVAALIKNIKSIASITSANKKWVK